MTYSSVGLGLFILLCSLLAVTSTAVDCLQICNCQRPSANSIVIDCTQREMNDRLLHEELDLLLSDNELRGRLTSLRISNTSLTELPLSVCRLSKLTSLNLDRNRLVRLPGGCLTNMTRLQVLSAVSNNIAELQDGLFDGINSLRYIHLQNNRISSIGLRVFSNPNDLVNLKWINLYGNLLRSLEPWPYIIGLNKPPTVEVRLGNNRISKFTNNIGWKFNCAQRSYAKVALALNYIKHVSDIFVGWNITSLAQYMCLMHYYRGKHHDFDIDISWSQDYHCDCKDFELYKLRYHFFANLLCSKPVSLPPLFVASVQLKEMVCDWPDHCPSSCRCIYRPANATFHVDCSSTHISSLPLELPPLPKHYDRYKLDFSNNKLLRRLESRTYFVNTSILDVSNSAVSYVDLSAWREFPRMQSPFVVPSIYLHDNKLESLPFEVTGINFTSVRLTLSHNPWECSCASRWMIDWFKSLHSVLQDYSVVTCASPPRLEGRGIVQSDEDEFCVDPALKLLKIALSSTLSVVVFLLVSACGVYRLRVRLYRRFKFHPFNRDECVGEDMDFDVYLCCSSEDHNPHGLRILETMESKGYRVCYHLRDFLAGAPIADNMMQSVVRSKRTVCLISNNFLQRWGDLMFIIIYFAHDVA